MTELKTLKDIEKQICYKEGKETHLITHLKRDKYLVADVEELREAAIEWIKALDAENNRIMGSKDILIKPKEKFKNFFIAYDSQDGFRNWECSPAVEILKHFFNITDKDLKE